MAHTQARPRSIGIPDDFKAEMAADALKTQVRVKSDRGVMSAVVKKLTEEKRIVSAALSLAKRQERAKPTRKKK